MHDGDRPCTDRLDEATRADTPPRPPMPRWRIALHATAVGALAAAAVIHGIHWATALPAEIPSIARAVTAVLWAALLFDLVLDRLLVVAVRAVRADIAAHDQHRSQQITDLTAQVEQLTKLVGDLQDALPEMLRAAKWDGYATAAEHLTAAESTPRPADVVPLPQRVPQQPANGRR